MVSSASSSRFRFLVFYDDDDDRPSIWPLTKPFKRARFENVSGARFSASATKDASRASPLMGAEDPRSRKGPSRARSASPQRSVEELLDPRRTCCERCPAPTQPPPEGRAPAAAPLRTPPQALPRYLPLGVLSPPENLPRGGSQSRRESWTKTERPKRFSIC